MELIAYGIRKAKPTQSMRGIMMSECYGCNRGFIAILHTCGTSARERFIDYLHTQEREGE